MSTFSSSSSSSSSVPVVNRIYRVSIELEDSSVHSSIKAKYVLLVSANNPIDAFQQACMLFKMNPIIDKFYELRHYRDSVLEKHQWYCDQLIQGSSPDTLQAGIEFLNREESILTMIEAIQQLQDPEEYPEEYPEYSNRYDYSVHSDYSEIVNFLNSLFKCEEMQLGIVHLEHSGHFE